VKILSFHPSYHRNQLKLILSLVQEKFPRNETEKDLFHLTNKIKKIEHSKEKLMSKTNLFLKSNKINSKTAEIPLGALGQKELLSHRNIKKLKIKAELRIF
jgi:hypothetical protein